MNDPGLNEKLISLIERLKEEEGLIHEKRKDQLIGFAKSIESALEKLDYAKVIFVCTHNSRRSQLGQLMLRTAVRYYGFDNIYTYSGGTEATAFNHRMVAAAKRAGFIVQKLDDWDNPKYLIHLSKTDDNHDVYFSKRFDESYNPAADFIAVMVCNDADEACPFVPGAIARISLPYLDPKSADDTPEEPQVYDDKVLEIGREILFTMKHVST